MLGLNTWNYSLTSKSEVDPRYEGRFRFVSEESMNFQSVVACGILDEADEVPQSDAEAIPQEVQGVIGLGTDTRVGVPAAVRGEILAPPIGYPHTRKHTYTP